MSTPIPPSGSGIATQASTTVTATAGASGTNSGNVSGGSGGTAGSIPAPPPSVVTLLQQIGSTITGTLTARAPGQITLSTPQGPVQVSIPTPLPASIPANATLLLQVTDTGPPLQVLIQQPVTPSGGGPAGAQTGPAPGSTTGTLLAAQAGASAAGKTPPAAPPPTLSGTPVTTTLTQGATIAATVSGASFTPPSAQAPVASAAPSPAAASIASAPTGTGTPAAGTGAANPSAPAGTANPSAPAGAGNPSAPAGATNPSAPAAGPGALPKNAYLPVRVLGLQLPSAPPLPATLSTPLSFFGTVTGATVDGQTIVTTPNGLLTLATRSAAPIGTRVLLEAAGKPTLPPASSRSLPQGMTPTFEALRHAIEALQVATPNVPQTILQQLIPQPGPQMGIAIVFFLQALRGGALDRWLGQDGLRALKRTAGGSGPLEQEFSSPARPGQGCVRRGLASVPHAGRDQ